MITKEQFEDMVNKVAAGEGLTNAEASELIQTAAELDQRGAVAEQIIDFTLTASEEIYRGVAQDVVEKIQLRDKDKVRQILNSSKKAAENLTMVVQLYVSQMSLQMQQDSAVADADPDVLDDSTPA